MPDRFQIRAATPNDAAIVAHHRASMFRDMGSVAPAQLDQLTDRSTTALRRVMEAGQYLGWLASPTGKPETIVAGAGVLVRNTLPFPRRWPDGSADLVEGRQALVMNVFTEPDYRRQGAARALMLEILAWARREKIESLVLHAAPDGRPLYESLGFVPTNEMRFSGDLTR